MVTISSATDWEARFRIPRTLWARVARRAPERGLVASSVTGAYQLHRWSPSSGAMTALTDNPVGRAEGWLSPDGRWVVWHEDEAGDEHGRFVAQSWDGERRVVVAGDQPEGYAFTAAFSPDGSRFAAPLLAGDDWRLLLVDWSPDGPGSARLVEAGTGFVSDIAVDDTGLIACTTTGDAGGLETSVRITDASGAVLRTIEHPGAAVSTVAFAPDRSRRLLAATTRSGRLRPLVVGHDGKEREFDLPDVDGDLQPTAWSPGGARVILLGSSRSTTALSVLDVATGTVRAVPHAPGAVAIGSPKTDAASYLDDGSILTTVEDGTRPPSVVALDPETGAILRTLIPATEGPVSRPWRSVDIPSTDGAVVQGWLAVPGGTGPFPTILDVHGGPEDQENDRYFPAAQAWLDRGYAVLTLNYRGSRGFGRDFEQSIWGDPGRRELDDMVAARGLLVEQGIADPAAVVPSGGSYGGYLTLLAMTGRPDLWAAGVAYVAIADWTLMYEDGEALRAYQEGLFGGGPSDRPERYAKASPITRVADLRAPLLIIQGRNDPRCPPRQLEAFADAAHALGLPVEVDWFDAGHGHGDAGQRIAWQARAMDFVDRALGRAH
jgi:dipeptidyl aminopeptidase/acylaminoacyl peptidase